MGPLKYSIINKPLRIFGFLITISLNSRYFIILDLILKLFFENYLIILVNFKRL